MIYQRINSAAQSKKRQGFTLIEMLTVIGIISLIAAMVIPLNKHASDKRKKSRVSAELAQLQAIIDDYHSRMGFYPPDNAWVEKDANLAGTNQLYYELVGAALDETTPAFTINGADPVSPTQFDQLFHRGGIANSTPANSPEKAKNFFPSIDPKSVRVLTTLGGTKILGFAVPVDLNGNADNFWFYDSSSTNRHNSDRYDLWAVYSLGKETVTNGNWK